MARILAIDDDPDILLILERTLTRKGHRVVTSGDPALVAGLAIEHHVDAVILDVMMPGMSGYEALKTLRDEPKTGGIPILFLSARAESEDRVRGLKEGANDYLTKPFDMEELALRVERLVATRSQASAPRATSLKKAMNDGTVSGQLYLGRYQALEVIGRGAMGLVFRGWDPRLKRPVALKVLRLDQFIAGTNYQDKVVELLEEAVTTARLNHPNIVSVFDADTYFDADTGSEMPFMAMEYVDGTTLAHYLRRSGRISPEPAILLALAIGRGLAAAHESRIVHHDVKPANVLLGRDGSVKIGDFGVAGLVQALIRPDDGMFGTIGYLPPEALMGEGFDEAGDLFALGSVIYECVTGQRAFPGAGRPQRIYSTLTAEVIPPDQHVPDIPRALGELILELLHKDREARLSRASEVVRRLESMVSLEQPRSAGLGSPGLGSPGLGSPGFELHAWHQTDSSSDFSEDHSSLVTSAEVAPYLVGSNRVASRKKL